MRDVSRFARNGIVGIGILVTGAGWHEFYSVNLLTTFSLGALVALAGIWVATR